MRFRIVAIPLASSSVPLSRTASAVLPTREALGSNVASSSHSNTEKSTSSSLRRESNSRSNILYYYHFHTFPSETNSAAPPNLLRKGVDKAVQAWNGMGLAPEGNWKRRIYTFGERLMDRIDFEETSLKHLHPPSGWREALEQQGKVVEGEGAPSVSSSSKDPVQRISLVYPSNFADPLSNLRETIAARTPLHRKGFWTWLIIAPFTAPFAIVPVIPNLPFFFAAWRSWSHHRAWKSADYLQYLIENGHIRPEASEEFAELYPSGSPDLALAEKNSSTSTSESDQVRRNDNPRVSSTDKITHGDGDILLSSAGATELVKRLQLQDGARGEITKALEQTSARLQKSKAGS